MCPYSRYAEISVSNPAYDFLRVCIYVTHSGNLIVFLIGGALVYANGVNKEFARAVFPKPFQSLLAIDGNWNRKIITDDE
jgi:hypothetical protein